MSERFRVYRLLPSETKWVVVGETFTTVEAARAWIEHNRGRLCFEGATFEVRKVAGDDHWQGVLERERRMLERLERVGSL